MYYFIVVLWWEYPNVLNKLIHQYNYQYSKSELNGAIEMAKTFISFD